MPNFGASRLGFWHKTQTIDRSVAKSKNVLIVYDLNSYFQGVYTTSENPAMVADTVAARETALGFTPTIVRSYAAFSSYTDSQLATYSHIWDVGYNTLITNAIATKFSTYLIGGGALFLLGEHGSFAYNRDLTISNFITTMGGGTVVADVTSTNTITAAIAPEFLLANNTDTVTFAATGRFSQKGTGTVMAYSVASIGGGNGDHAIVWKTGSLSGAPNGAIVSVLDINTFITPYKQVSFIDNLIYSLNRK
jgi:hypothetical protein